jgi:hypothetical protein
MVLCLEDFITLVNMEATCTSRSEGMAIPLHIEGLVLGVNIHFSPEGGIHCLSTTT